jgi:transcriptional regulator of arginine metabolism
MVSEVLPSANLVVIRTYPGMASTVAAVLDQSGVLGLLGTIAGDDTVFAVGDEMTDGKTLAKRIAALREAS